MNAVDASATGSERATTQTTNKQKQDTKYQVHSTTRDVVTYFGENLLSRSFFNLPSDFNALLIPSSRSQ